MIQTLRVTSVVVGLVGLGLIALSVVHGIEPDAGVAKIMASTAVLERFENRQGRPANASQTPSQSPLVSEAERYARIVNPPPPPVVGQFERPSNTLSRVPRRPDVRPPQVSAQFSLEGTCYNAHDPNASLAFIDEPGKGKHWIRQGDRLGHLTVEEILDGVVRYRDGQTIEERRIHKEPKISLYAGTGKKAQPKAARAGSGSAGQPFSRRPNPISVTASSAGRPRTATPRPTRPPIQTTEDAQEIERIVSALKKNLNESSDVGKSPEALEAERQLKERTMERLMQLSRNYMSNSGAGQGSANDPNQE